MPTTGSSPADRKFLAEYEGPILTGKVIDLSTGVFLCMIKGPKGT